MTSTGALIVPKMLFHMLFQYQRHGINIKFPVTFFEMIAASKQQWLQAIGDIRINSSIIS
ncbi:hypothetical protein [Xenorhabdus bovienii]|uniref:hypothetical protein n=1 Tax=Xenorhabdus bovienii TaxID=40576 RepID=UPI0012D366DD